MKQGLLCAVVAVSALAACGQSLTPVTVDGHSLRVEVAASEREQRKGLMERTEVPDGTGMVFVFERAFKPCMWMKDTPAPLSVGFFDKEGALFQIEDLQPHSEVMSCARAPTSYALEVRQGWFDQRGIKPGARLKGAIAGLHAR